jgi:hypothetical protein
MVQPSSSTSTGWMSGSFLSRRPPGTGTERLSPIICSCPKGGPGWTGEALSDRNANYALNPSREESPRVVDRPVPAHSNAPGLRFAEMGRRGGLLGSGDERRHETYDWAGVPAFAAGALDDRVAFVHGNPRLPLHRHRRLNGAIAAHRR